MFMPFNVKFDIDIFFCFFFDRQRLFDHSVISNQNMFNFIASYEVGFYNYKNN